MLSALLLVLEAASDPPEVGPLDISYSTVSHECREGTWSRRSLRARLMVDGRRVYFLEEAVDSPLGSQLSGREYLDDGELVYVSNALGMTTIYDARKVERFESTLFLSSYGDALGLDLPNTRMEIGEATVRFDRSLACSDRAFEVRVDGTRWLTLHARDGRTSTWRLELVDRQEVVTSVEVFLNGRLLRRSTSCEFVRVGASLLPRLVTCEQFDTAVKTSLPVRVEEIVLESFLASAGEFPRAPSFMRAGTFVRDARLGTEPTAAGGFLAYQMPLAIEELESAWNLHVGPASRGRTVLLSPSGVLVGLGGFLIARAMKRRRTCY